MRNTAAREAARAKWSEELKLPQGIQATMALVQRALKVLGLSQKELAAKLHVTQQHVSRMLQLGN